jgi:hypothetical protein
VRSSLPGLRARRRGLRGGSSGGCIWGRGSRWQRIRLSHRTLLVRGCGEGAGDLERGEADWWEGHGGVVFCALEGESGGHGKPGGEMGWEEVYGALRTVDIHCFIDLKGL